MFVIGCVFVVFMALALFADQLIRVWAGGRRRSALSARPARTDRGLAVVEVLVVLLISSIFLAIIIFAVGALGHATRR